MHYHNLSRLHRYLVRYIKMKRCERCDKETWRVTRRGNSICGECDRKARLDAYYKRTYKLSYYDVVTLFKRQKEKCKICGIKLKLPSDKHSTDKRACVDHCHTSGDVRGILCTTCNTGLGALGDTKESLEKALKYLEETDNDKT